MRLKFFQILLLILTLVAANAHAQSVRSAKPKKLGQARVDFRQARQETRIEKGLATGRLTEKEYKRLQKRQDRIEKAEAKALADGKLSKKEARKLERLQDRASKRIYAQKHDKQRNRMKRMQDRVAQGVKDGKLTEAEQKRLAETRQDLIDFRKQAKADGQLSAFERKTLRSMKDDASKEIYRLKHNNRAPASADVAAVTTAPATSAPVSVSGVQ